MSDGWMIAGAENGLFFINTSTFTVDTFTNHPLLKRLAKSRIVDLMVDGEKIWIGTSPAGAAWCYDLNRKELSAFNTKNGLSSDRIYCFAKDRRENVYVGTYDGLNIIGKDGKIRIINKENGLRHPRVDNLVFDNDGYLWITNFNSLIRYDPVANSFRYFDERNGVNNAGFSITTNCITRNGELIFGNNKGLLFVNPQEVLPAIDKNPIRIRRIYADKGYELLDSKQTVRLTHDQARLSLYYSASGLVGENRMLYQYKMEGWDTGWSFPTKIHEVNYSLGPGKYVFRVMASYNEGSWNGQENAITIIVAPPFWQTWWFTVLLLSLTSCIIYFFVKRRIRSIKTKALIRQQMAELEGKALRAQMNPHFIFNSLNAIQELIVTENYSASYDYLSKFSKLLRLVLNNSEKNFILLKDEIEMNQLYLQLESLRFKQSFHYEINIEDCIDTDSILFPSLLIQPFIENAIWHGLMHKEGEKKLLIRFSLVNNRLYCFITDNGIGRAKSAEIKARKLGAAHFSSKGMQLAAQRIGVLQQSGHTGMGMTITDLYDDNDQPAGTRIEIVIPAINL
jgi:hypothetical protein